MINMVTSREPRLLLAHSELAVAVLKARQRTEEQALSLQEHGLDVGKGRERGRYEHLDLLLITIAIATIITVGIIERG